MFASPSWSSSPGFAQQQNYASITELWKEITGQPSAARTLYTLFYEGADETAIQEVLANNGSPGYFFSEAEINAYGYIFLQQEKVDNAIRMFRINVDLYPESWNVYDSLGEALLERRPHRRRGHDVREVDRPQPGEHER